MKNEVKKLINGAKWGVKNNVYTFIPLNKDKFNEYTQKYGKIATLKIFVVHAVAILVFNIKNIH